MLTVEKLKRKLDVMECFGSGKILSWGDRKLSLPPTLGIHKRGCHDGLPLASGLLFSVCAESREALPWNQPLRVKDWECLEDGKMESEKQNFLRYTYSPIAQNLEISKSGWVRVIYFIILKPRSGALWLSGALFVNLPQGTCPGMWWGGKSC